VLVFFCTLIFSRTIGAWSIPLGWILGFVFHVTHRKGMRLMDPIQEIDSGISLNQISRTIEINLLQMLGEKNIPLPIEPIDDEYIL
jgi:putative membrane protein